MSDKLERHRRIRVVLDVPDWYAWGHTPEELVMVMLTADGEYGTHATIIEAEWMD